MLTVGDIKKATKGTLIQGDASNRISSVSIDTRTIKKRSVFIAICGQRFNGHHYVRSAIQKGAKVVIVSQRVKCSKGVDIILVKDTTQALGQIALWYRRRYSLPVIAITGSTGKTTTKELVASVLSKRLKVLKNIKTENNHIGVPLTLLKLRPSHQIAVLELGTNQPGDIRWLAKIVQPTVSIFTNIGQSHLERLKSERGVLREKAQLVRYTDPKGVVIINSDDEHLRAISKSSSSQKFIRYGIKRSAVYKAERVTIQNNLHIQFNIHNRTFRINTPVVHNVYNALAAISCGLHFKIRYNEVKDALSRFRFKEARQEIIKNGRYWFIDDTYNANPLSLQSAINTLSNIKVRGKRVAVCADMLELGSRSEALHRSAGKMIARSATDAVFTIGKQARHITKSLNETNGIIAVHCQDLSEIHRRLKSFCAPGDAVLIKGSRGMKMERTVAYLKTHLK